MINDSTTSNITGANSYISINEEGGHTLITGEGNIFANNGTAFSMKMEKGGIKPKSYFKYVKSKFGAISGLRMKKRVEKLEKLFNEAVENGQVALSEEFLKKFMKELRESEMYALNYKIFIETEYLEKFRYKIKTKGQIRITNIKNFTRLIPKDVKDKIDIAKKKKIFDDFVIVHYDPDGRGEAMTEEEKEKDPIVFGIIKESNRYYYIADWEDEYCDLTLDDIIDKIDLDEEEMTLNKNPKIK